MTTALLAVPLWIMAAISIWHLIRNVRAERKYRNDVDAANELMRAGQEMLRRFTTPAGRTREDETLH